MLVVGGYSSALWEASRTTQSLCPVIERMLDLVTLLCFIVFIMGLFQKKRQTGGHGISRGIEEIASGISRG